MSDYVDLVGRHHTCVGVPGCAACFTKLHQEIDSLRSALSEVRGELRLALARVERQACTLSLLENIVPGDYDAAEKRTDELYASITTDTKEEER